MEKELLVKGALLSKKAINIAGAGIQCFPRHLHSFLVIAAGVEKNLVCFTVQTHATQTQE